MSDIDRTEERWPTTARTGTQDGDARREQLEALQLAKLRVQCEWAAHAARGTGGGSLRRGSSPSQLRSLDDLRRMPLLTRDQWMASQFAEPPYGELPTIGRDGRDPGPHDLGDDRPWTAAGAGLTQGLGVDRRDVGVCDLGLRRAAVRHGLHRVRLRVVHRLLGTALRDGEGRRAERPRRRPDDRGARAPDRRLRRDGRRLDADLRPAAGPGGRAARDRSAGLERCRG